MPQPFYIPIYLDLLATYVFALTGAVGAIQRSYDYIGVFTIAMVAGVGGSILRDGVFLQRIPLTIADSRYLIVIIVACLTAALVTRFRSGIQMMLVVIDAFGLGAYAVIGTQASRDMGVPILGAALVGMFNSVGGGMLRDIMIREEPLVFRPSEFYAIAALAGIAVFVTLDESGIVRPVCGLAAISTTIAIRLASVYFGWKTTPVSRLGWLERPVNRDNQTDR